MADKSKQENPQFKVHKTFTKKKWLIFVSIAAIVVLTLITSIYILIPKFANTDKDEPKTGKVLTIKDLEDPNVELTSTTPSASVNNLTDELKAKIDQQIAAKVNPFETVNELASVLSSTTNDKRQDQLSGFLVDFLAKHEDALWFMAEFGKPDQAQVNFWKSELYTKLVYNYQFIMLNKFTGSNDRPIDNTKEQLKYINLYLTLANDPKSHIIIAEDDKGFIDDYQYSETEYFLKLKNEINAGQYNG